LRLTIISGRVRVSSNTLEEVDAELSSLDGKNRKSPTRIVPREHRVSLRVDGRAAPRTEMKKKLIAVGSLPLETVHDHPVPGLAKKDLAPMRDPGREAPVAVMLPAGDIEGRRGFPGQESCTSRAVNVPETTQDALVHAVHDHRIVGRSAPKKIPPALS
jgi:hypothetical protein